MAGSGTGKMEYETGSDSFIYFRRYRSGRDIWIIIYRQRRDGAEPGGDSIRDIFETGGRRTPHSVGSEDKETIFL